MSGIRSALEELAAEDVRFASDGELVEGLREIERAVSALEVERARRVSELEERGVAAREGLSVTSFLADRFRMAPSWAARYVAWARALARAPRTREALAQGEIHPSAAAVLLQARGSSEELFERDEEVLVDAARTLPHRDLRRVVAHWRQAADPVAAADEADRLYARRRLHVSPTLDGMVRVDGDLDPETGQTLITALDAVVSAEIRDNRDYDMRSYAQRRADALAEICRRYLDSGDRPEVGGERPHVVVNVDLAALLGDPYGRAEFEDAGLLTPPQVRRWSCDADLIRLLSRGRSQPLDVGRRTPVVSPALRRALVARDRGCRYPGCGRPPRWCEAHHVKHWADGGETCLANTILLCRRHHRMVHLGLGLPLVVLDGQPTFLRAGGEPVGLPP
ncbi:MAG TPA: DUF222 domain-containing protein [Actinomycetota bacterium]|nr:DUF222 domain-containing protein [Actinomycetota bacterium]